MCDVNKQADYVARQAEATARVGVTNMCARPELIRELRSERADLSQRLLNTERLIRWLESNPEVPLMVDLLRDRAKGV